MPNTNTQQIIDDAFEKMSVEEILGGSKKEPEPEEPEGPDFEGEFLIQRERGTQKFSEVFECDTLSGVDHDVTVFSVQDWDQDLQGHIPEVNPLYQFPREALEDLVLGIEVQDKVNIIGPTGSGKTTLVEQYCARTNRPFYRFNGRGDMESGPMLGQLTVQSVDGQAQTVWEDGLFTEAVKRGAVVLFDEWTATPPEINMSLQSLLEENGALTLTDKPGSLADKEVHPHPDFRLVCADNTGGLGDMAGAFAGTNVQNTATLDRFFTTIHLDYLDHDHEFKIVKEKYPELTDEYLNKMLQFCSLVRTSYNQGELDFTMSPRTLLNWAQKTLLYQDKVRGLKVSFLKKFSDDAQKACLNNHFFTVFKKSLEE